MSYLLVPKENRHDRADVWIGTDEGAPPGPVVLRHPAGELPVGSAWQTWTSDQTMLHHQTVTIGPLAPRTEGRLQLLVAGQTTAHARLTTLPDRVPTGLGRPLTFVLGSCYCTAQDAGRVDGAWRRLAPQHRPDFKILCGDQVYLDSPWFDFLRRKRDEGAMRASFLDRYRTTWFGVGPGTGLSAVLADGANYFSSDDHELWNNAPSRATVVRDTWFSTGRERWKTIARSLYEAFQTSQLWTQFEISPLSFYVADCRLERDAEEKCFMPPEQMTTLARWLANLRGPGVLVLGQPLFMQAKRRLIGHLTDWGLPDYEQYRELARAIRSARHDVLVLSGDVHYRRFAHCRQSLPSCVYEVISSPMALVDEKARGDWEVAPGFPPKAIPGVPSWPVHTEPGFKGDADHFLVFQCTAAGTSVRVRVFDYAIAGSATVPPLSPRLDFVMD